MNLPTPSSTLRVEPFRRSDGRAGRPAPPPRAAPVRTLFISGPDGDYRLGDPMLVHDLRMHLGTMEAPGVSRERSVVQLGRFLPSPGVDELRHSRFAPLLLAEAIMFIAQRFQEVEAIHFTLEPPVDMCDGEVAGALSRLTFLERAGATGLQVIPSSDAAILGSFVIRGTWAFSGFNLAALAGELFEQRFLHSRLMREAPGAGQASAAGRWLGRQWERLKP